MTDIEYQDKIREEMRAMEQAKHNIEVLKNALIVAAILNDGKQVDRVRLQLHTEFDILLDSSVTAVSLVQMRGRSAHS